MAKPFVKWAGGKTQLMDKIDDALWSIRRKSQSFIYVEPFVGGGSVLFHLLDTCSNMRYAIINDSNSQLMNCYSVISDVSKYSALKDELMRIQNMYNDDDMKEERYKLFRFQYNHWINGECDMSDVQAAAVFMFLNKCGFNGLYRVNSKGEFNVPWGQKTYLNIFDETELDKCHVLLNEKVVIMNGDYSCTSIAKDLARIEGCDLIYYFDPPYKPITETSNFTSYTKNDFGDKEQIELKRFCDLVVSSGGNFVLSNSKCGDFFENLYSEYHVDVVTAKRNINSVGSKRGDVEEVLISSYKEDGYSLW